MENQTPERRQRVLSAIQPTAIPTLGNYLGALRNWKAMSDDYDCVYAVADLHAIFLINERKIFADFQNEIFEVIDDSRRKVALGNTFGQVEEIKRVSIEEYIARRPLRLGNGGCCGLLREHIPFVISAVYLPLQFALAVTLSDAQSHIEQTFFGALAG